MSYDSNISVLYVYDTHSDDADAAAARDFFIRVGCDLTAALRDETPDGSLYNVELPPWPRADGWLKACSLGEYVEHYAAANEANEQLALRRARPVAGDANLGARFMALCESLVCRDER
jgi:glutamate-ammonia-ligase adenylyltransferase